MMGKLSAGVMGKFRTTRAGASSRKLSSLVWTSSLYPLKVVDVGEFVGGRPLRGIRQLSAGEWSHLRPDL